MAFPLVKLVGLLLKQISKPVANYVKNQARSSPVFRTYICMPLAQIYNEGEVKIKMWILNLGKPVNVPVLNEAMAIDLGANILGEFFIFGVPAGLYIFDYHRSRKKEAAKEKAFQELFFQVEEQRAVIKELQRTILNMESQVIKKPWAGSKDNKSSDDPPSPPGPSIVTSPKEIINAPNNPVLKPKFSDIDESGNLLSRAFHIVKNEFLTDPHSQNDIGILAIALNHLYKDVYKLSDSVFMY